MQCGTSRCHANGNELPHAALGACACLPDWRDRGRCVSSPRSAISGPVAKRVISRMRLCTRTTYWLLSYCDGWRRNGTQDWLRFSEARPEQLLLGGDFNASAIPPVFPCSPSVTRSVLVPHPAARRVSASLAAASALRVSVSGKSFVQRTQKHFPDHPKKTPLGTWERGTSRRFAQECPE